MTVSIDNVFRITEGELLNAESISTRLLFVTASTVCLAVIIKWYFGGGVCRSKARLDGKSTWWKKIINLPSTDYDYLLILEYIPH